MKEITRRDFEFYTQNGFVVVLLASTALHPQCKKRFEEQFVPVDGVEYQEGDIRQTLKKLGVKFYYYDITTDEDITTKYGINNDVTMLVFRNGKCTMCEPITDLDKIPVEQKETKGN